MRTLTQIVSRRANRKAIQAVVDTAAERGMPPVIINNFNRLRMLEVMLASLHRVGLDNVVIIDNGSTFKPLLKWYKASAIPTFLHRNIGPYALWRIPDLAPLRDREFIYSDPDIEIDPRCPTDLVDVLRAALARMPEIVKAGPSLRIDDIPDRYRQKERVIKWESQFWESRVDQRFFLAPIDTTLALHRAGTSFDEAISKKAVRAAEPYMARHLPWYCDSANPTEEELWYEQKVRPGASWWARDGQRARAVMAGWRRESESQPSS